MSGMHYHAQLLEIRSHKLFPGTSILLISASRVARMIGMSHWCQAKVKSFFNQVKVT
jgi:hypothetical protein